MSNTAQEILDAVGGPGNITHFTHCATRLRFELNDASIMAYRPGCVGFWAVFRCYKAERWGLDSL